MKRTWIYLPLMVFVVSCQSGSGSIPPELIPPEVSLRQIGGIQEGAAQHVRGAMPVNLQAVIISRSSEPLSVERIEVVSRGQGAYSVPRTSRPFSRTLNQDRAEAFEFWVSTNTENTILGVGGPVTLQMTVYYLSPYGKFREVYTRDINTSQVRERRE